MTTTIADIHAYWFGELDERGLAAPQRHALWFKASAQTDRDCRERFGKLVAAAVAGDLQDWEQADDGLVALILLLDQFTRNIHRGTARAFAGDARALSLAREAVTSGRYRRLPAIHQAFLYMPLEHCEDLATQHECVALFEALAAVTGDELIANFTRYAVAHRDIIATFGRFPHRNAILGRTSSAAELAHLQQHGGF